MPDNAPPNFVYAGCYTDQAVGMGAQKEIQLFVPENQIWRFRSIRLRLVTDSNAGNRLTNLVLANSFNAASGAQTFTYAGSTPTSWGWVSAQTPAMVASKTYFINYNLGYPLGIDAAAATVATDTLVLNGFLLDVNLFQGWSYITQTQAMQAGDLYTAVIVYDVWKRTGSASEYPGLTQEASQALGNSAQNYKDGIA